jgi:uncharacterized membrane protein
MEARRREVGILVPLLVFAYPFAVWGGLHVLSPRILALVMGSLLLVAGILGVRPRSGRAVMTLSLAAGAIALVAALIAVFNEERVFLFVPTLVSGVLLVAFARTLVAGPSLVETIARLRVPDLPEDAIAYCRQVTRIWCGFFLLNGTVALWLALSGRLGWWTAYTGGIAYVLIGLLLAVEFAYRTWRFRAYATAFTPPLVRAMLSGKRDHQPPNGPAR